VEGPVPTGEKLAEDRFEILPCLRKAIRRNKRIRKNKAAFSYYFDSGGDALSVRHRLVNKAYASTLKQLAREGAITFYNGSIANQIATSAWLRRTRTQYEFPRFEKCPERQRAQN
jgi:gamma-glutamyltranspeptidase/glutathione hydrolase